MSSALDAVASWPVTTAGVAVVGRDGALEQAGPADIVLRWASVTKILTALAAWIAIEEGTIALDDPAGPPGSTVRHLLAHASGLAFDSGAVMAAPGRRRIYSNRGFEVLAGAIGDRAGMSFGAYLSEGVLRPLAMTATTLDGSPAAGARGPLTDLVLLTRELLEPRLVSRDMLELATSVAFPELAGILPGFGRQQPNDWGLGVELHGTKWPHWMPPAASRGAFGHFGRTGSFVWVDPDAGVGCACLSDREFGPWAAEAWPALGTAVLDRRRR